MLFDSNGMAQALLIYRKMFDVRNLIHVRTFLGSAWGFAGSHPHLMVILVISAVLCFWAPNSNRIMEKTKFTFRDAAVSALLLGFSLFNMSQVSTFLYFNF